MDKKKRKILASAIGIVIVFLLALLIYANFVHKDQVEVDPDSVTPSSPTGGDVDDSHSTHAPKDFDDDTNSDASDENVSTNDDDIRLNISPKLSEIHTHEKISITSMTITSTVGTDYATVGMNIKNDSDEFMSNFSLLVSYYNKSGELLSEVYFSSPSITPGEVVYVEEDIFQRVIDAYDYSFTYFIVDDEGGGGL